ncbi:hypothetical protein QA447_05510 [Pseudomonas sp. abacavir_1]
MKAFAHKRGQAVGYFFVLDERRPVLPFGVCGPFAKRREAKKAASKLRGVRPESVLSVYGGTVFGVAQTCEAMTQARLRARDELSAMLQAPTPTAQAFTGLTKE